MKFTIAAVNPVSPLFKQREEVKKEIAGMWRENSHINSSLQAMRNVPGPAPSGWNVNGVKRLGSAVLYLAGGFLPGAAAAPERLEPLLPVSDQEANPAGSGFVGILTNALNSGVNAAWLCAAAPTCRNSALGVLGVTALGGAGVGLVRHLSSADVSADKPATSCLPDNQSLLDMLPENLRGEIEAVESRGGSPEERIERIANLLQRSPEAKGILDLFSECELTGDKAGSASVGVHRSKRTAGGDSSDVFLLSSEGLVEGFKNGTGRISSIEPVIDDLKRGLESAGISAEAARKEASAMWWIQKHVVTPRIERVSGRIDRINNLEENDNVSFPLMDILRQGLIRAGLRVELGNLRRIHMKVNEVITMLNRVLLNAIG